MMPLERMNPGFARSGDLGRVRIAGGRMPRPAETKQKLGAAPGHRRNGQKEPQETKVEVRMAYDHRRPRPSGIEALEDPNPERRAHGAVAARADRVSGGRPVVPPLFPAAAKIVASDELCVQPLGEWNLPAFLDLARTDHRRYRRKQRQASMRDDMPTDIAHHPPPPADCATDGSGTGATRSATHCPAPRQRTRRAPAMPFRDAARPRLRRLPVRPPLPEDTSPIRNASSTRNRHRRPRNGSGCADARRPCLRNDARRRGSGDRIRR